MGMVPLQRASHVQATNSRAKSLCLDPTFTTADQGLTLIVPSHMSQGLFVRHQPIITCVFQHRPYAHGWDS